MTLFETDSSVPGAMQGRNRDARRTRLRRVEEPCIVRKMM